MFDIGIGEIILIAILGLLVFGPERLPRAAADAARMIRNLRQMASGARKEIVDNAGIDLSDAKDALTELRDLHPKRLAASIFDESETEKPRQRPADGATGQAAYDPDAT